MKTFLSYNEAADMALEYGVSEMQMVADLGRHEKYLTKDMAKLVVAYMPPQKGRL